MNLFRLSGQTTLDSDALSWCSDAPSCCAGTSRGITTRWTLVAPTSECSTLAWLTGMLRL